MKDFEGKVALVTGAGSGIGQMAARFYARDGARVVVSDIVEAGAKATVDQIVAAGGEAVAVAADVADPAQVETLVLQALEAYGRLDLAFNNAGIGGENNATADYSLNAWRRVIDINLSGAFYCMKYELPALLRAGGGAIVNMTSVLGQVGFARSPAYVAAKHGLVGLTRAAALEYATQGIRINAIGPGFISTPLIAGLEGDPQLNAMLVGLHPMGRLGTPEEVAEVVMWLSSARASFVTGAYISVDGGYLAR